MIIAQFSNESQNISVLPRFYGDINIQNVVIELTNEDTREQANLVEGSITKSDGFLNFDINTSLENNIENSTFKIKITDDIISEDAFNPTVIFRGLLFITNQSTQDYSIYG